MEISAYQQFYELEEDHWWFAGMRTLCRGSIKRLTIVNDGEGKKCLDVGCGTGLWMKELESFGQVCGLDVAPEALHFCRNRGINRLVRATAEHLPFRPESFSLITAIGVIEHLDDEKSFLSELSRVCRPGGHIVLLTSAYNFLWSRHDEIVHHKRRYTKTQFRRLLGACGFEVVQSSYVNTFLFLPIFVIRLGQRLGGTPAVAQNGSPDVFRPSWLVNKFLYGLLWMEARLLNIVNLPFGVGLFAVVQKPLS